MPPLPPDTPGTWLHGQPRAGESIHTHDLFDPSTGSALQTYRYSSDAQIDAVLEAATLAHQAGGWARAGVVHRAAVLTDFARRLDDVADEIAELDAVNSGVPIRFCRMFAHSLSGAVRHAVELAELQAAGRVLDADGRTVELRRIPWGPTAILLPWNAPAAVLVKNMSYALVAGAPVVAKPSPESPWSAEIVARAITEAGVPEGVFGLVHGGAHQGGRIVADPRVKAISMTGSTATGQSIAQRAGRNLTRMRLELGSNNPAVVLADADIEATARALAAGFTKLNGQWCEAPRAVLVASEVADAVVDAVVAQVEQLTIGASTDEQTTFGPMAFEARKRSLEAQVATMLSSGSATSITPLPVPADGWFIPPTLVRDTDVHLPGEVFGPVLAISSVRDEESAITRANELAGGLAAYVFSGDEARGLSVGSRIVSGEVKVNGTSLLDMAPESAQSFFGHSGLGGHGDRDVLEFFAGKQVLGVDLVDPVI